MEEPPNSRDEYIQKVLSAYRQTPGTAGIIRQPDRVLAARLPARRAPGCGRKRIGSGRGAPHLSGSRISAAGHDSVPGLLLGSDRRSAGVARQTRVLPVSARQDPTLHPNGPLTLQSETKSRAPTRLRLGRFDSTAHACGVDDMTTPRTPAAWMILLALSHIKTHAYGVDDLRFHS